MATSVQVISVTKETTGTNGVTQDVTTTFTPKAAIVISDGGSAASSSHFQRSIGFSDGINQSVVSVCSLDNAAAASTARIHKDGRVYIRLSTSTPTNIVAEGSIVFGTNKVTFTWNDNETAATKLTLIVFGGADITDAKVDTVSVGRSSAGTQDYTCLGFTPESTKSVLFTLNGSRALTDLGTTTSGLASGFGCAVSSTKRWATNIVSENGADPTDTWRNHSITKCLVNQSPADGS